MKRPILISIILLLISMFGASWVQTSGYQVKVKDLRWETPSGYQMSALLYIPPNATKDTPAPAIVTSHGWYNTREMQDLNYVELSKRGFVVVAIDMYGHGNSDPVSPDEWKNRGTGMYDAVELVSRLPYVDVGKIGVTGHSNGARASNWSVLEDNKKPEQQRLISSVLLIANDAMYSNHPDEPLYWSQRKPSDAYVNNYGSRNVGLIAAQYDEFFFRSLKSDGTSTPPREFASTEYAQSFLNFGQMPTETRKIDTFYSQTIEGKEAVRILHTPNQIHPWNHFSTSVVKDSLVFFEKTLGAPTPLPETEQSWQYKVFFNALGVVGFFIFVVGICSKLLDSDYFSRLKAKQALVIGNIPSSSGKLWFWGGAALSVLVSAIAYIGVYHWSIANRPSFLLQPQVFYIGVWSAVMGLFTLILGFVSYFAYGKKHGVDLITVGVRISFSDLFKSILLAICVVSASFLLVFIADYFFKVDFRIWVITIKTFSADKIGQALLYLPFFLLFYVANSIAINCFNYFKIGGSTKANIALMMLFNGLSSAILIAIQYGHFYISGEVFFTSVSHIVGIWLFPMVVMIPLGALVMRAIYNRTNNPYLGGLIYSMIVTLLMCSNTLTQI